MFIFEFLWEEVFCFVGLGGNIVLDFCFIYLLFRKVDREKERIRKNLEEIRTIIKIYLNFKIVLNNKKVNKILHFLQNIIFSIDRKRCHV